MTIEARDHTPGSFWDSITKTPDGQREFRWRQSLVKAKESVISNSELKGYITPQYAQLLRSIHTSTGDSESTSLKKVKTSLALRQRLQEYGIAEKLTANIGSGTDWEFPVALGARNITMIDPSYNGKYLTNELLQRVRQFDPRAIVDVGNRHQIIFDIDVGNGKEKVALHLDPSDVKRHISPKPYEFTVECSGPSKNANRSFLPIHPRFISNLNKDSLILSLDFPHDVLFSDDLGLKDVGTDGYHLYKVKDWASLTAASKRIEKPLDPSTVALRRMHKQRKKNS